MMEDNIYIYIYIKKKKGMYKNTHQMKKGRRIRAFHYLSIIKKTHILFVY